MRSGEIEANLVRLNDEFDLSYLPELIAIKTQGQEKGTLSAADVEFPRGEYKRLVAELERVSEQSQLPDAPSARPQLSDLLLRLRAQYS